MFSYDCDESFYQKGLSRNIFTTWQWLYWIKLFSEISVELNTVAITAEQLKRRMSHVVGFGNTLFV